MGERCGWSLLSCVSGDWWVEGFKEVEEKEKGIFGHCWRVERFRRKRKLERVEAKEKT